MGDILTWLSGIASLIGLVTRLLNLFPKFAAQRNAVILLLTGIFIGSSLRAFDSAKITFNVEFTFGTAFLSLVILVILAAVVASFLSDDGARRAEFYSVAGFGLAVLFFASMIVGVASLSTSSANREQERLSLVELRFLSDRAVEVGDYEKAIRYLEVAEAKLPSSDERRVVIKNRIAEVKNLEISTTTKSKK